MAQWFSSVDTITRVTQRYGNKVIPCDMFTFLFKRSFLDKTLNVFSLLNHLGPKYIQFGFISAQPTPHRLVKTPVATFSFNLNNDGFLFVGSIPFQCEHSVYLL